MKVNYIITDLHLEYHGETGCVHVIVEFQNGKEHTITTAYQEEPPLWAREDVDEATADADYEEWYNDSLAFAHKCGYLLEGEAD